MDFKATIKYNLHMSAPLGEQTQIRTAAWKAQMGVDAAQALAPQLLLEPSFPSKSYQALIKADGADDLAGVVANVDPVLQALPQLAHGVFNELGERFEQRFGSAEAIQLAAEAALKDAGQPITEGALAGMKEQLSKGAAAIQSGIDAVKSQLAAQQISASEALCQLRDLAQGAL